MLVFSIKNTNIVPEVRAVSRATRIVTSRGAPQRRELSPHNSRRQGRSARGALPHSFHIGVFKTVKKNSTTMYYIYN